MANVTTSSTLNVLLRFAAFVALVAITTLTTNIMLSGGFDETYQVVVRTLTAISYLLIVPSYLLVILGRARSHVLRLGVTVTSAIALLALGLLAFGMAQDSAGVLCDVLLAWNPGPCVDAMWAQIFIVLFYPPVFILATLTVSGLLAFGLVDEYRRSQANKQPARRKR
jgi:hypothetical protein